MRSKVIFLRLVLLAIMAVGLSRAEAAPAPVTSQESGIEDAVINVAATVGKAVISISTEYTSSLKKNKKIYFNAPFGNDESLRRFFEDFFGEMPEQEYRQRGLGSGVIIDPEGYILTNEHVIADADKITVTLSDGREFRGEVKGKDSRSDLTVIKINAANLPAAALGDSDNLRIGQWVVAIGNPFAFAMHSPEPTVTSGVVSALHRSLGRSLSRGRERDYNDLIQTDAAINPGNSGGPLVNLKGEIVGINVAIFSTSGGYQGIGFAIPINNAKRIISRLIEGKKIIYGWLGVTVQDLTQDLAKHLGLSEKGGALVANVLKDGPADKAGIKDGDVIREFDGQKVASVRELLNLVGKAEVGRKVKVVVMREKKEMPLNVQIGERPENLEESEAGVQPGESKKWRGLEVSEVKKGVVIADVEPASAADEAGLIAGEIILEIDKQPVNSLADYQRIIKAIKGDCLVKTSRGFFLLKGE